MTTLTEISDWVVNGKRDKHTHLLVVCDTFDWEDYPVYADGDEDCKAKYKHYNGNDMQRVMEVYDLRTDTDVQLKELRSFHLPK
jgi:hypothetical protein